MNYLACFSRRRQYRLCLTPVLDIAHLDSPIHPVTSNNSTPWSREITATATTTATAKSCRIGSGWYVEQRWGRKEGYASETTGRCSIFCLIMKSVNVVVFFCLFFVFLQVLPRRQALREAREDKPQATEWWDMFRDKGPHRGRRAATNLDRFSDTAAQHQQCPDVGFVYSIMSSIY